MLKKTVKYKDLDGNEVEDDFYFNLNKAEILELELKRKGGLEAYMNDLVAAEDGGQIIGLFKEIIEFSIGRRSGDGKRFIKNQEIRDEFFQSDAFSSLLFEFLNNPTEEMGAAFMRGIVPADVSADMPALNGQSKSTTDVQLPGDKPDLPAWYTEGRVPTEKEFEQAPPELQKEAFRRKTAQ